MKITLTNEDGTTIEFVPVAVPEVVVEAPVEEIKEETPVAE